MKLTFDVRELDKLNRKLNSVRREFGNNQLKALLKDAVKPVLDAARAYVPVGSRLNRSSRTFVRKSGKTVRDGTYDRGGATRRDLRIKIVEGQGAEAVRALVGVNKARGHVGWRAHFITRGTMNRVTKKGANRGATPANDFLSRAEAVGVPLSIASLSSAAQAIVRKALFNPA